MTDYRCEVKEQALETLLDVLIKLPPQELGEAVIAGLMLLRDKLPAMRECMREVNDSKKTVDAITKANEDAYQKLALYRNWVTRFEISACAEARDTLESEVSKDTEEKRKE
jgi:hypothetical protein